DLGKFTVGSLTPSRIGTGALNNDVIASSITLAAMYGAPSLVGTNFTNLPGTQLGSSVQAANIANGYLASQAIASGNTFAAMYDSNSLVGTNFTGIPDTALSNNVELLNAVQTISGNKTFSSSVTVTASGFSVGGSTLAVKGGNVGIGTNNPGTKLEVNG